MARIAMVGIAVGITFFASGMAMAAVRGTMVETISAFIGKTAAGFVACVATRAIAAEACIIATTVTATITAGTAAVTAWPIRNWAAGAQFILGLQSCDGVHLDALVGVAFDALQQLRIAI
jgi:hypothetical protein